MTVPDASDTNPRFDPVPARVGRYRVEQEIARGATGVVYAAVDPDSGKRVAIKLLSTPADRERERRVRLEARAMARLRHSHIVSVVEFGTDGERSFLVMELVEGESLQDAIQRRGPLPVSEVIRIGIALARAIAHAHRAGVLHRDIKPENVLLDGNGVARIADFGLAKLTGAASPSLIGSAHPGTIDGQLLGTPPYMSPEQVDGDTAEYDERSDVYGLGATLYAMMTGGPPFASVETLIQLLNAIARHPPADPSSLRGDLPRSLVQVVMRCLEKDKKARFRSADELAQALERSDPDRAHARAGRATARRGLAWAGLLLICCASLAWGVAAWGRGPAEPTPERTGDGSAWRTTVGLGDVKARAWRGSEVLVRGQDDTGFRWAAVDPETGAHRPLPALRDWQTPAHDPATGQLTGAGQDHRVVLLGETVRDLGAADTAHSFGFAANQTIVGQADGSLFALVPDRDAPVWQHRLVGRVETRPLPLDLDGDEQTEHVLAGSCAGELLLVRCGDGAVIGREQAGGPLQEHAFQLFGRAADGAQRVLVSSPNGTLLVLRTTREGLVQESTRRYGSPFFTAAQVVGGPDGGPAQVVVATALGITSFGQDLSVAWVTGSFEAASPRGEIALVDLDGDRQREIAVAMRQRAPHPATTIVVYDARGRRRHTLPMGDRDVVLLGGPAPRIIGHDRREVAAWGPFAQLSAAPAPATDDLIANVIGGAYARAQTLAQQLAADDEARLWDAIAAWYRGHTEPLATLSAGRERELGQQLAETLAEYPLTYAQSVVLASLPFLAPLAPYPEPVAIPSTQPSQNVVRGVDLTVTPYAVSGVQVTTCNDRGGGLFDAHGWLEMELFLDAPARFTLAFHHQSWEDHNLAWSEVRVLLNGEPAVPQWCATERGTFDRIPLGRLDAGSHRIRLMSTQRSLTVWRLYYAFLEQDDG